MRHSHKPRIVWLSMFGEPVYPGKITICTVCGALRQPSGKALRSGGEWGAPLYNARHQSYPEGAGLHLTGEASGPEARPD